MRFATVLVPENPVAIPENFYEIIAGFIKEELRGFNLEGEPYTFSLKVSPGVKYEEGTFRGVRFLVLKFSTGDSDIFNAVIDSVIRLKDRWEGVAVGEGNFRIGDITVEPEVRPGKSFITLSPVVVRKDERFILPDTPNFTEALVETIERRMGILTGKSPKYVSVRVGEYTEAEIPLSMGKIKGFVGRIVIGADRDTLRFVYDYGIGNRTVDGFGMLEVN